MWSSAQMPVFVISNIIICRTVWAHARHHSIAPCPWAVLSAGGIPIVVFGVYSIQIRHKSYHDCWWGTFSWENGHNVSRTDQKRLTMCSHARLSCITPHAILRHCGKVSSIHIRTCEMFVSMAHTCVLDCNAGAAFTSDEFASCGCTICCEQSLAWDRMGACKAVPFWRLWQVRGAQ